MIQFEPEEVQITDGRRLSCKLEHLILYVKEIKVYIIDFVFVCRRKNFTNFEVFNPTSSKFTKHTESSKKLLEALEDVLTTQRKIPLNELAKLPLRKVCSSLRGRECRGTPDSTSRVEVTLAIFQRHIQVASESHHM